jgi:hypothetical protein
LKEGDMSGTEVKKEIHSGGVKLSAGGCTFAYERPRFFSTHRQDLSRVHVLVGSKVVYLTIAIAQHLSRTGNLIQIYSDPETFAAKSGNPG